LETAKYQHGVFSFYTRDQIEYFGISFQQIKSDEKPEYNYSWQVPRKFHNNLKELKHSNAKAVKWVKEEISCCYPTIPGTFQPIAAPKEQIELFRYFVAIASTVEDLLFHETNDLDNFQCDQLRLLLNQQYEEFVNEYGVLQNYKSYFEGIWWFDVRLSVLLLGLEKIELLSDSSHQKIIKAEIFKQRQSYPQKTNSTIKFNDENINTRITKAFDWCLSSQGKIDLDAISLSTNLAPEIIENKLLELNLVYREIT
jgi:hypothetical protein